MAARGKKAKRLAQLRTVVVDLQQYFEFNCEFEFRIHVDAGNWAEMDRPFSYSRHLAYWASREGINIRGHMYCWPDVFKMWRKLYGQATTHR